MKRVLVVAAAMIVMVAGMVAVGASDAEAGLLDRIKCKLAAKKCCQEQACCESAPQPEATSACECAAADCEAQLASCCPTRREQRLARRRGCCAKVQTCGSEAPAECESESAPEAPESDSST